MKYAIILFSFILFASCKKNEDGNTLPPPTQTGANTFGGNIDGVPVSTNIYMGQLFLGGVEFFAGPSHEIIISVITTYPRRDFMLVFDGTNGFVGMHKVNSSIEPFQSTVNINAEIHGTDTNFFFTDSSLNSEINISKFQEGPDPATDVGAILSGTFDIKMKNSNGKIIHLSDGRFDIKRR